MTPFYLYHTPEIILPNGIEACIFRYKRPHFFAVLQKIGKEITAKSFNYAGCSIVFGYTLHGASLTDYVLTVDDQSDKAAYPKIHDVLVKAVEGYIKVRALETSPKKVEFSSLKDYHHLVPALQVLHLAERDEFLASYGIGINAFMSLQAMGTLLSSTLKLPQDIIRQGTINDEWPGPGKSQAIG